MRPEKVLIIVPAYNESGNVGRTVAQLRAQNISLTVLVVNDASLDKTVREAKEAGALVASLPFNLGIGGAVQTGFQYALKEGFTWAVQVDGDGQHDARFLKNLLNPVQKGDADLVIGSRFLPPHLGYQSSFIRRVGIQFFANLISRLTGYRITDPTSGFRAVNQKLIRVFAENYPHDFPEPEAIVLARMHRARVLEVPVEMRERMRGVSSIRYLKTLYYMIKVTFAILLLISLRKKD